MDDEQARPANLELLDTVRMVDLFCGCGGLSLGFELHRSLLRYQTVLAVDNDAAPLRCYNLNLPSPSGAVSTGRLCDVTWFTHPSEVLLYYLVHFALWKPDAALLASLGSPHIGVRSFFSSLRRIDAEFEVALAELMRQPSYKEDLNGVDAGVFKLAICKAFLSRLGLVSLGSAAIAPTAVPWREEQAVMSPLPAELQDHDTSTVAAEIESGLRSQWDAQVSQLAEASSKVGRGQHSVVAQRLRSLVGFLRTEAGENLKTACIDWRARRDSLRAVYCTAVEQQLLDLYSPDRRVHLLLGGPPCKGFSRIGRGVIESLRDQGAHAWTSKEYGDERNALLHKYVLFLEALRPDAFVFENVAHFQSSLRTPSGSLNAEAVLARSIDELSSSRLHFDVKAAVVKARQHAVPQDRERFIMVGFNCASTGAGAAEAFFSLKTYDEDVPLQAALQGLDPPEYFTTGGSTSCGPSHASRAYTLLDSSMPESHIRYLEWIRQPLPGGDAPPGHTDAHIVRRPRADDLALIQKFAPGQRWMDYKLKNARTLSEVRALLESVLRYVASHSHDDLPSVDSISAVLGKIDEGLLLRLILEEVALPLDVAGGHHLLTHGYLAKGDDQHGDWFERLSAERPCKTIVAHIGKDTYGYIHPYSNRAISMREAARVQTFPDFFSFGNVGIVEGYAMIGNAVPPLLANAFAGQMALIHESIGVFVRAERRTPAMRRLTNPKQLSMTISSSG